MKTRRKLALLGIPIAAATLALSMLAMAQSADAAEPGRSYPITLEMRECGVMAVGVTGTCIISLQTWLNIFDDAGLVVDGNFGPATEAAVRNFQSRHGLVPDGRFGDASRNALRGVFQYMMDNSVPTPKPGMSLRCQGYRCDSGAAVAGGNGGLIQSLICIGIGKAGGLGAGVFCEVWLQ